MRPCHTWQKTQQFVDASKLAEAKKNFNTNLETFAQLLETSGMKPPSLDAADDLIAVNKKAHTLNLLVVQAQVAPLSQPPTHSPPSLPLPLSFQSTVCCHTCRVDMRRIKPTETGFRRIRCH